MTEASSHFTGGGLAPYLGKLGLHTEPFSEEIQDEFFLLDAQRTQLINMLYHLAHNSELLLVVTGQHGIGKTSLLQHFIDMGDETWRSCVIDANTMMNPEQLLIQIAEGFGLPQDSVTFGNGIEMLKKRLVDMKRSELVSVLIIDDAHELPTASLTMLMKLSELSDEHEGLLRIILFSEPQLVDILNASSLKDVRYRVTHTLEMPILSEQETMHYIQHRLSVAGIKDAAAFSGRQLKKIYLLSGGIPGKINLYAHKILLGAKPTSNTSRATVNLSGKIRSFITILLILVITVGITWVFTKDALNKLSEHLNSPDETQTTVISDEQKKTLDLPLLPAKPIGIEKKPGAKIVTSSDDTDSKPVNAYALRKPDIQTAPIDKIAPAPEVVPSIAKTETLDKPAINGTTNVSSDNIKPPATSTPEKTISPVTTLTPAQMAASTTPVSKPKTTLGKPVPKKPVVTNWLTRQNPNHYTLQIMGSRERESVAKVLHAYKLGKQAAIIKTRHKGSIWYILVYGAYTGPRNAKSHIPDLPRKLTSLVTPWPRKIGDIKQIK